MSTDISRVYAFLAKQGDWVNEADKNGDGAVIKSEFRDFMEENFEWNGEESTDSAKNDLINSFWKTIDTNQSGKVSGTKLKNKNALDKKELAAMEDRIEMYEILNEFTSQLTAPSVVGDGANWKKSVSEGLGALIEQYIKNGGTPEDLPAYLAEQAPLIEAKATADYCANEYLAEIMGDVNKEYGYTYGSDQTLQGMINSYIQSMTEGSDAETIQQTVQGIIDAYVATAGLGDESSVDMGDYGYTPTANSPLNDLQKAVIKTKLQQNVQALDDYETHKDLYEEAMNTYLGTLKFGDFEEVNSNAIGAFEASDAYKGVVKAIATEDIFGSEELKSALASAISESFAERLNSIMPGELEAYDKLLAEAKTKAQNGDFDTAGELDTQKLIDWVVEQAKSNLAEFYPNGFGDMPLEDMNTMYDALVASAKENKDAAKIKEAAISYCKAVSSKSTSLANAVKEIFGDSYATNINKLLSGEIEEKMEELKLKVLEIGDASTFTITGWNGLPADGTVLNPGSSATYSISATIDTQGGSNPKISYSLVNVSGGTATCSQFGDLSITAGSSEGYINLEVAVLVDGITIGTKAISIKCEKTVSGLVNNIGYDSWGGTSEHLEVYGLPGVGDGGAQVTSQSFADLYNNNAVIMLHMKNNNSTYTDTVKNRLSELCGYIVNALVSKGLDATKLQSASNHVVDTLMSNYYRKGKSDDNTEGTALGTRVSNKIKNGEMTGVVKFTDFKRKDYQVNMVSFKEVVDLILQEYGY